MQHYRLLKNVPCLCTTCFFMIRRREEYKAQSRRLCTAQQSYTITVMNIRNMASVAKTAFIQDP